MSLYKWSFKQPRVAVSIAVIIFSALLTSAKTPTNTKPAAAGDPVFNLSDFDPVGDGVADDGPALQRALDALANAGGGTLLIPAGSYRIKTPVEKDFSSVSGARVNIQGVPSTKMPAPVTATGEQLSAGLDLTSEIIPATGDKKSAITLSNLRELTIEHMGFTGTESSMTDAFITLYLIDIDKATVRHCEFYGISSFGVITELGGGNIIRALRSELSIELSVFLGCTANSGAYGPIVENLEWRRFSISNSIFIDYGQRTFYSKMGMGAPLSWIGIEHAAIPTPESPRREVIVRDTFLDEGGWVGISVLAHRHAGPPPPMHLLYISGLKMNVSNMISTGHLIYDIRNLLIENSHYGWSINSYAAIDINRVENAILDNLTCIDHADRIRTDDLTGRLTLINSVYQTLDSLAGTTTILETTPEQDPVQYVRQQFLTVAGRQPDPAAHFYWSDLLIRCGDDDQCLSHERAALSEYLGRKPQPNFTLGGTVKDENGAPVSGAEIKLSGSQSVVALTDAQGNFRFSGLPTSGGYTVEANKRHYTFTNSSRIVVHPTGDVTADFDARLNRHSIAGRISKPDGAGFSGVTLKLAESPGTTVTSDANGLYSFAGLAAGKNYTLVPSVQGSVFDPENITIGDLASNQTVNFIGDTAFHSLTIIVKDENGEPLGDTHISMDGSKSAIAITDSEGSFEFEGIATNGSYSVGVGKRHYSFETNVQSIVRPTSDVNLVFKARLHRHTISGRVAKSDGTGIGGVKVQLTQSSTITATTDSKGFYSFPELAAGENYTVVPLLNKFAFAPLITTVIDLSQDRSLNFVGTPEPELLTVDGSEFAIALDPISFMKHPFSIVEYPGVNPDEFTRVMIFAKNLELVSGPSEVSVVATDDEGQSYPVEIEFMGDVTGLSLLKQLNLKFPSDSVQGKCLQLRISVANSTSNETRICIGGVASPLLVTK